MKRSLIFAAAFAALLSSTGACADSHQSPGLQLYSLRATTLAHGLTASLDLAKKYGVTEVETGGSMPGLTMEQIRAEIDARGLKCVSMHLGYEGLTADLAAQITNAKTLGVSYAFCPWIPHKGEFDMATVRKTAEDFNKWGEAFRAAGITFGYHVHGYEFVPTATPGETLMDELIRATKPEFVSFEMDVFWTVHGGGDPVALLKKYPKRWSALHVKELRKGAPFGKPTGRATPEDEAPVGAGAIDWKAVIGAAEKAGVRHYFIEDETAAPLENIPQSLAYVRALKL